MLEVRDQLAVEPESDAAGLAFDPYADVVPGIFPEVVDPVGIGMNPALRPRQIDGTDVAAFAVVERDLVALSVLTYAEENAAVDRIIELRFQLQLEVAVLLGGDEEAAVSGRVLVALDGAVDDVPLAADLILGKPHVALPALERLAVEERDVLGGVLQFGASCWVVGAPRRVVGIGRTGGRKEHETCDEAGGATRDGAG